MQYNSTNLIVKAKSVPKNTLIRASITSNSDLSLVSPSSDLYLTYSSLEVLSSPTFFWFSDKFDLSSLTQTSSFIKIPKSLLSAGASYSISLNITDGSKNGVATTSVNVNSPPTRGIFEASPQSGVALSTLFELKCGNGWTDSQLPLTYQFFYYDDISSSWTALTERTETRSTRIKLPSSSSSQLRLKVAVYDSKLAFTESEISVAVTQPTTTQAVNSIESTAKETPTLASVSAVIKVVSSIAGATAEQKAEIAKLTSNMILSYLDNQAKAQSVASENTNSASSKLSMISSGTSSLEYIVDDIISKMIANLAQTAANAASSDEVKLATELLTKAKEAADKFYRFIVAKGVSKRSFSNSDITNIQATYDSLSSALVKDTVADLPANYIVANQTTTYSRKVNIATLNNLQDVINGNKFKMAAKFSDLVSNYKTHILKVKSSSGGVTNSVSDALDISLAEKSAVTVSSSSSIAELTFSTSKDVTRARSVSAYDVYCQVYNSATNNYQLSTSCSVISKTSNSVTVSVSSTGKYLLTAQPKAIPTPVVSPKSSPAPVIPKVSARVNNVAMISFSVSLLVSIMMCLLML